MPATVDTLYVYLHTHWDREWYLPFNHYRAFLLERFRQTFAGLESGEVGVNFYFDGQAIVFEDLIQIDPSFGPRIKNLMKKGLLSAGPWYVLPDQSLVGGESLIRNLKVGIETVRQFGVPTLTGYNPDTFCHVQDLPRILQGCGIDTAMVLRGVPEIGNHNAFWWESPDGSAVLTYWFNKGLTHTTFHYTDDVKVMAEDLSSWWQPDSSNGNRKLMLFSSGKDHTPAPGQFKHKMAELNKALPKDRKVALVSMDEFLVDLKKWAKAQKLPEISGDLRDNTNTAVGEWFPTYVLDGVSSTRLYLKRANVLTEHRITRTAEPLFAMLQTMGIMPYPKHELDYLWKLLIQNHPHDSICGCSVDPVHEEMMTRTQQINSFMDGLEEIAMNRLNKWGGQIQQMPQEVWKLPEKGQPQANDPESGNDRLLVFNTACHSTETPVKMTWYAEADSKEKPNANMQVDSVEQQQHYLFYTGDSIYYKPIKRIQGWIYPGEVPALGYSGQKWPPENKSKATNAELDATKNQISNGLIGIETDSDGNLVAILQQAGKQHKVVLGHEICDVGDGGDSYSFDPLADDTLLKATLTAVKPGKEGPLVSSLIFTYEIDIPEGLDTESDTPEPRDIRVRSKKLIKHVVDTEVSVRKNVPILFFKTTWENYSKDHRLEVRFKTQRPATESVAECHFSTAKHTPVVSTMKLPVVVGKEAPPSSYFCQRFFIATDQVFFNCGMPEYRIEKDYAAITLLRATSYLSRGRLRTRGGGAGTWTPTPEANCLGENSCDYGMAFLEAGMDAETQIAQAYKLTDLFEGRLIPFYAGKSKESKQQSLIEISNPDMYVTAMYMEQESLMLRILNTSHKPQQAKISTAIPISKVSKTNLLGEHPEIIATKKELSSGAFKIKLSTNELVTLKIEK